MDKISCNNRFLDMFILFVLITVFCGACSIFNSRFDIPPDNLLEEAAEEVLRLRTGFDIDFSSDSKE